MGNFVSNDSSTPSSPGEYRLIKTGPVILEGVGTGNNGSVSGQGQEEVIESLLTILSVAIQMVRGRGKGHQLCNVMGEG